MQDIETERLLLHVNSLEEMDMAIAKMKVAFQSEIKDVWNVVTSLDNSEWRSDISKIEVISDKQFIEYMVLCQDFVQNKMRGSAS